MRSGLPLLSLILLTLLTAAVPPVSAQVASDDGAVAPAAPGTTPAQTAQITVTGQVIPDYAPPGEVRATKNDIPLLETPQAISVVTRALLDDQNAQKLDDALKNVSGVNHGGYFAEWDYYRIRGFDVSYYATYLNGLLNDQAPGEEIYGLERVEVIKGPASTLYGAGPLGGFVNLVSKHPQPEFFGEVQFTAGSYDFYEGAADFNTPLTKDQSLDLRVTALYRSSDSFIDFAGSERIFIAPALTWKIDPDTTVTLLTSFKADRLKLGFPLPARGTVLPNINGEIPISRYIGNPAHPNNELESTTRLGYEFNHRFNEHLSIYQNFRYFWLDFESNNLAYPGFLDDDQRTLELDGYHATGDYKGLRVDTGLNAIFETGPVKNYLTLGIDYRFTRTLFNSQNADPIFFDVIDPDYAAFPDFVYGPVYTDPDRDADLGFYIQEYAKIFDRFSVTLGGRFDHSTFDAMPGKAEKNAFTPKVGLTYEIESGVVAYANYSRSFNPQWFYTDASGRPVDPETGDNYEIGLKTSLLEGRLTALLAVYQLTRQNVATDNLATPDPFDSIVSGEQRSRGVELEGAYGITKSWEITGAYSYISAEITKDTVLPVGATLAGVPRNSLNLWTKYTLRNGRLKGLGFGAGGRYYTAQGGDLTYSDSFDLPAYGIIDAAVYYSRGPFRAQVNVNNLLDRRYFVGAYNDVYVLPGEPRTAQLTVGWAF